jgi:hypothetical protein
VVLYIFIILEYRIKMLQDTIHMKSGLCCDLDQLRRIIKAYDLSDFFFVFPTNNSCITSMPKL